LNSVFSVGLQPYISQSIISVLCCSISLICGIIASVELFLALQNMMEKELISSKEFYILSYDIFKTLSVERQYRMLNGKTYLDNIHTKYSNLVERSNLIESYNLLEKNKNFQIIKNNSNGIFKKINKFNKNIGNNYIKKNNFEKYINNDFEKIDILIKNNNEDIEEKKEIDNNNFEKIDILIKNNKDKNIIEHKINKSDESIYNNDIESNKLEEYDNTYNIQKQ